MADAVRCRSEIDLRIGASLTRLMCLNFKDTLGVEAKSVLSYGPC